MVSIIIPAFNRKKYVEKMIICVISQTYSDWELLIVDDGSFDGTYEMICEYARNNDRIQVIRRDRPPKGGQTCRNIGLEKAKGKYVVFFDSDDLISEDCLEQRVDFMELHKNIDFGIFPAHSFNDEKHFNTLKKYNNVYGKRRKSDAMSDFLKANYQFIVCTNIYRRDSLKNIKWNEKISVFQDLDFNLSNLFAGNNYDFCESAEFDYFYRNEHEGNSVCSNVVSQGKHESTIYLFGTILNKINQYPNFIKYKHDFKHFIIKYYRLLISHGDTKELDKYLNFCQAYFTKFFVLKLDLVRYLSLLIPKEPLRNKFCALLLMLGFGYRR